MPEGERERNPLGKVDRGQRIGFTDSDVHLDLCP
jgi:hypothetical protein